MSTLVIQHCHVKFRKQITLFFELVKEQFTLQFACQYCKAGREHHLN